MKKKTLIEQLKVDSIIIDNRKITITLNDTNNVLPGKYKNKENRLVCEIENNLYGDKIVFKKRKGKIEINNQEMKTILDNIVDDHFRQMLNAEAIAGGHSPCFKNVKNNDYFNRKYLILFVDVVAIENLDNNKTSYSIYAVDDKIIRLEDEKANSVYEIKGNTSKLIQDHNQKTVYSLYEFKREGRLGKREKLFNYDGELIAGIDSLNGEETKIIPEEYNAKMNKELMENFYHNLNVATLTQGDMETIKNMSIADKRRIYNLADFGFYYGDFVKDREIESLIEKIIEANNRNIEQIQEQEEVFELEDELEISM